ncbi:long-chain fatty acid--CoA ligase [Effusibacillus lacus]|uniref:Long-chain-fatty-acid--CoA ligase n=1 Tax=Effusibacillus lacus TaxID=1348429 RepID=A0A292YNB6_9BACL|nr:long-chain fatty acid--CoA ligase [Effusibacillus lacus]TCS71456.1 fatty-acyl-CoA synthase [Effusibacillus lacus]GAX89985.1 long-chain-fatty-acid--CoA ligase [Effusibacillus lacus]
MNNRHFAFWPKRIPKSLVVPKTTLCDNLEVTVRRYPEKQAIIYYGTEISYKRLAEEVNLLAGFLQNRLGVAKGDRVLLFMQNSPQFMISFYAILRANAIVVPINPMNITEELAFYIEDSGAKVALVGQELYDRIAPLKQSTILQDVIVAAYSDYAPTEPPFALPEEVAAPRMTIEDPFVTLWTEALSCNLLPGPVTATYNDIAVLPYTSGTTGRPKGCIHTHETCQANIVGGCVWSSITPNAVVLTALPLFHVTGLQHSMNAPIQIGATMVVLTRWNRDTAAQVVERYECTHWTNISTMVVDFLSNPNLSNYNLASLSSIGGGGAPLPEAVGEKLFQLTGVRYAEGYGLSETMAQTHVNPPDRPKLQCMGIPAFNVDARIINPETLRELGPGEEGEVIVNGPQVFRGYWNRPEETEKSFIQIDGKRFFRTGDIAKYDEEGYFFMVDRVKRMINASGYKVWPAEVEAILYKHPAVQQACVIGVPDARRGETVKAFVVLHEKDRGTVSEQDIIEWSKNQMAAYKYPRIVQFMDRLPMSGSGKILWRKLQEMEQETYTAG